MSKLKFKGKEVNLKGLFHTASAAGSFVSLLVLFYVVGWYTAPIWISTLLTLILVSLGLVVIYHLIAPFVALTKFAKNYKANRKVKQKADLEQRIATARKNSTDQVWLSKQNTNTLVVMNAINILEKELAELNKTDEAKDILKLI